MDNNQSNENNLLEPPQYDMLFVRFRGDDYTVVLPYCEVANGDISHISDNLITLTVTKNKVVESLDMDFKAFTKFIETTFDIKEIIYLAAQIQLTTEAVVLYESQSEH